MSEFLYTVIRSSWSSDVHKVVTFASTQEQDLEFTYNTTKLIDNFGFLSAFSLGTKRVSILVDAKAKINTFPDGPVRLLLEFYQKIDYADVFEGRNLPLFVFLPPGQQPVEPIRYRLVARFYTGAIGSEFIVISDQFNYAVNTLSSVIPFYNDVKTPLGEPVRLALANAGIIVDWG